jgi:hypothetical protein
MPLTSRVKGCMLGCPMCRPTRAVLVVFKGTDPYSECTMTKKLVIDLADANLALAMALQAVEDARKAVLTA